MQELSFTSVWYDDHIFEAVVTASNESFAGRIETLLHYKNCSEMIDGLKGFPKSVSDEVKFNWGDELNRSSLSLHFYCRDSLGNPSVSVAFEEYEAQSPKGEVNRATIIVHCDPEGVRDFCSQFKELLAGNLSTAKLEMI